MEGGGFLEPEGLGEEGEMVQEFIEDFTVTVTVVGGEVRPPQSVATTPTLRGGEGGRLH